MFFEGLREDEDVVQIDYDYAFRDKILEDVVHHCLEGGGNVVRASGFVKCSVYVVNQDRLG